MVAKVTVKRTELFDKLRALSLAPKTLVVGVLGDAANAKHKDAGENTVAQVAQWNHYGTGTIPARPFLTIALAKHAGEISKIQKRLAKGLAMGKLTLDQALALLGETTVNAVKQTIADGVPPPNAAITVARKGSSTPLIDTGQLRGSITYEVRALPSDAGNDNSAGAARNDNAG